MTHSAQMSILIILILTALWSSTANASDLDPNVDPRLNRKVTCREDFIQLKDVAQLFTKATGVTIVAGYTKEDWRVRERRLDLWIKDLPLSVALSEIAATLDYHISRGGRRGKWHYRIWQDKRGQEREEAERKALRDVVDQEAKAFRRQAFEDAKAALRMSPEEAAELKGDKPWMAYLAGTDEGRAEAEILASIPQQSVDALVEGRQVEVPARSLRLDLTELNGHIDSNPPENVRPTRLLIEPYEYGDEAALDPSSIDGSVGRLLIMAESVPGVGPPTNEREDYCDICGGIHMAIFEIHAADSAAGWFYGLGELRTPSPSKEEGTRTEDPWDIKRRLAAERFIQLEEPAAKPTQPELLAELGPLKVASPEPTLPKVVRVLADKTKMSYILESFYDKPRVTLPKGKVPLYELLDCFRLYGYVWSYSGHTVRITPRTRALLRTYEIPESLVSRYGKLLREKGAFDLSDIAKLCTELTDGQIEHSLPLYTDVTPGLPTWKFPHRMLRLYGQLSSLQKTQVATADGLAFGQLTAAQRKTLTSVLEDEAPRQQVSTGRIKLTFPCASPEAPDAPKPAQPKFTKGLFTLRLTKDDSGHPREISIPFEIPTKATVASMLPDPEDARSTPQR